MSDQDNSDTGAPGNQSGGATSTAGHGSTLGNEGSAGRTGYYNTTDGLEGNMGARDTTTTEGAQASRRFDEQAGVDTDGGENSGGQFGEFEQTGAGSDLTMEMDDTSPHGGSTGTGSDDSAWSGGSDEQPSSGIGDPGNAAARDYSGHGTYSGGGSNDPNAQENPPAGQQRGVGPGTFAMDADNADSTPGTPKGGTEEAGEDMGPGRYGGAAGGSTEGPGGDATSGATGSRHEMRESSSDAQTGGGQASGSWQGGSGSMHSMGAAEQGDDQGGSGEVF